MLLKCGEKGVVCSLPHFYYLIISKLCKNITKFCLLILYTFKIFVAYTTQNKKKDISAVTC